MEIIESNFYKSGKSIEQLKNDLKVDPDKFLTEDEIYMIKVNFQDGYFFEMPTGATSGTNIEKWLPGGFLPSIKNLETGEIFFPRETIFFKNNGGNSIVNYGDNFQLFLDSFGNLNYKKIYP